MNSSETTDRPFVMLKGRKMGRTFAHNLVLQLQRSTERCARFAHEPDVAIAGKLKAILLPNLDILSEQSDLLNEAIYRLSEDKRYPAERSNPWDTPKTPQS